MGAAKCAIHGFTGTGFSCKHVDENITNNTTKYGSAHTVLLKVSDPQSSPSEWSITVCNNCYTNNNLQEVVQIESYEKFDWIFDVVLTATPGCWDCIETIKNKMSKEED